jgi:hypothetical protein
MKVSEFLSDLYNDELSDLFIGNRNNREESRSKLLPLMNAGMLQAYAKYKVALATEELVVTEDVDTYTLAATDALAITDVVNSYGRSLTGDEVSILGTTLTFQDPQNVTLQVEYKTKPVRFTMDQDDTTTELVLPDLLVPWLACWVASKVYMGRKDEGSIAKGGTLLQSAMTYDNVFQQTNITNEFSSGNSNKLCLKGFA